MLQEVVSIAYSLLSIYYVSWLSSFYLIISLYLWLKCIFFKELSSLKAYNIGIIYSLLMIIVKSFIIIQNQLGLYLEKYYYYNDILNSLGISIDFTSIDIITTLIPDIIAFAISLFSFYSLKKEYFY